MTVPPADRSARPPSAPPGRPAGPLATVLATVTGNLFLVCGTLVLGTLGILASVVPPRGHWTFALSKIWSRGLLAAAGARVEASSLARLDRGQSYIFLANHQSLYDIPALIATVPLQLRFAAKRSLFRIPVFGWSIHLMGFIPVDRGDRSGARTVFTAARDRLTGGVSVLFFPEGSRSFDGELQPFERGGFLLAIKSGLPVVPVSIDGSLAVQMRGKLTVRPGTIRVRYGEPIDPTTFGVRGRRELEELVRRKILEGLGRSPEETGAEAPVDAAKI